MAVFPNKNLRCAAGAGLAFAILLRFHDEGAPNDGDLAKVLNLSVGKFKPDEFSTAGMEFSGTSHYVGLVFPFFLAATDDNGLGWHQFLDGFRVACEPGAPYGFARAEQLLITLSLSGKTRGAQGRHDQHRDCHHGVALSLCHD